MRAVGSRRFQRGVYPVPKTKIRGCPRFASRQNMIVPQVELFVPLKVSSVRLFFRWRDSWDAPLEMPPEKMSV